MVLHSVMEPRLIFIVFCNYCIDFGVTLLKRKICIKIETYFNTCWVLLVSFCQLMKFWFRSQNQIKPFQYSS